MKKYNKLNKFAILRDNLSQFLLTCKFDVSFFTRFPTVSNMTIENILINKFKLILLVKGNVTLNTINRKYQLNDCAICLIPPMCLHTVKIFEEKTEAYEIFFNTDQFIHEKRLIQLLNLQHPIYFNPDPTINLSRIVESIHSKCNQQTNGSYLECILLVQQILLKLHQRKENNIKFIKKLNTGESLIERMLIYIQSNEDKPISVSDVCDYLQVSQSYLYRCSKELIHMSPSDYINYFKMTTAEKYLKDNDLSIESIANKLGYSSVYYFSNTFKKHFGISPSVYRNNIYK